MTGEEKGRGEAHTPLNSAGDGGIAADGDGGSGGDGGSAGAPGGDVREFARMLEAEAAVAAGRQVDLFDEDDGPLPDVLPIGGARSRIEAARARGRPAGAGNKRTQIMRDYLLKRGFTHPMEALASVGSASVDEVAWELAGGFERYERLDAAEKVDVRDKALARIVDANRALLPYFESKRPAEVHVTETGRHVFVVGHLDGRQTEATALSLAGGANPFEDQ